MMLPELAFRDGLQSRRMRHIVEDRFHGGAFERRATIEGRDRIAGGIAERTETRVAVWTGVEGIRGIFIGVNAMDGLAR